MIASMSRKEGPLRFFYYRHGSYAVCGEHLTAELQKLGVEVTTEVSIADLKNLPCLVLAPAAYLASMGVGAGSVLFTMCETTGLTAGDVAHAQQYSALVTPSDWCSSVFAAHKANSRVHTCPLGSSPDRPTRTRGLGDIKNSGLVFSTILDETSGILRKGLNAAVQAFSLAFPCTEKVEFRIKTIGSVMSLLPPGLRDPRITNVFGNWSERQLLSFISESDVGVFPSRGEGFGLCHLDYVCQSIPLVTTGFGGVSEFLCHGFYSKVDGHFEAANDGVHRSGFWLVPEVDSIAESMRDVAAHWIQWRAKAHIMAESARTLTWACSAKRLKWILETEGLLSVKV